MCNDDILFFFSRDGRVEGTRGISGRYVRTRRTEFFHVIYIPLRNYIRCLILIRIKNKSDYSKANAPSAMLLDVS